MHEKEIHEKNLANYRNGTPHNAAKAGEIAPVVLMPGDPLRAKRIAETMLSDVHQFNAIRNMFGYTGMYQGKRISVMGSGMGAPSMGIYSYELYSFYEVQAIIRIGTCGGLAPDVEVGDLVIAMSASTDSNYAHQYELNGTFSPCCSYELLEPAVQLARARNMRFHVGNVFSSDVFSLYSALPP
ncbi:MAG TPA: purine-nucleoside phosphorylase, partial [Spirochaetaceae bacterium]|nr:purine-nucleoside phosphorylase [Spirochaetaceae bacterium]